MEIPLQKTITFLLFIGIGLLLKVKFDKKEELLGIKKIILNLALPATIFLALIGVTIDVGLMTLPFLALFLNLALFYAFPFLLPAVGIEKGSAKYRTARLLVPSLAPGLSCFPFVLEFLGEPYLAKAAMADLGNKVFVLIILYMVAMNWHGLLELQPAVSKTSKLKSLVLAMISEPVNIFIVIALILVFLGLNLESLPFFLQDGLGRLSTLMTPLVLLFIGLAVKIKRKQLLTLLSLLLLRAGVVVLLSAIVVALSGIGPNDVLLLLCFGLSACSFWPFSHIALIEAKEVDRTKSQKTFNSTFAINILALSFPLSTLLILAVLTSGSTFTTVLPIMGLGLGMVVLGFVPLLIKKVRRTREKSAKQKEAWIVYRTSETESI
jgi:hypothetical protein